MEVTTEDIAQALNISRNTVSKVLNGKHVSEKTHKAVMEMAERLKYKNIPALEEYENLEGKKILLVSSNMLMNIPFHIYVMKGMETELAKHNITLMRYTISSASPLQNLKSYIEKLEVDAIICAEFFKKRLIEDVLLLNLPTVFLDFSREKIQSDNPYDIVLMENINSVKDYCSELIENGICKTFGYVGDINNCLSFYERFIGMKCAMEDNGLPYNPNSSILAENSLPYSNMSKLTVLIKHCELPDCFVCANDFLALMMLDALNTLNIKVPQQIKVIGFENSAESNISTPTLSTINVNKLALGRKVVTTLLHRMRHKNTLPQYIYIKGDSVKRATTDFH